MLSGFCKNVPSNSDTSFDGLALAYIPKTYETVLVKTSLLALKSLRFFNDSIDSAKMALLELQEVLFALQKTWAAFSTILEVLGYTMLLS